MRKSYIKIIIGTIVFGLLSYITFNSGYNFGDLMFWITMSLFYVYGLYHQFMAKNDAVETDEIDKKINIYASAYTAPFIMVIWVVTNILIDHDDFPFDVVTGVGYLTVVLVYFAWVLILKRKGFPNE
ncbi:MAG: hypothetical protein ACI8SE_001774 [Bacteroidia bacterium]|jgi:hypothetical protein